MSSDNHNHTHSYTISNTDDVSASALTYTLKAGTEDAHNYGDLVLYSNNTALLNGGIFNVTRTEDNLTLDNGIHTYSLALADSTYSYVSDGKSVQSDAPNNYLFAKEADYTNTHSFLDLDRDGLVDRHVDYEFHSTSQDNLLYGTGYQTSYRSDDETLMAHLAPNGFDLEGGTSLVKTSATQATLVTVTLWLEGWEAARDNTEKQGLEATYTLDGSPSLTLNPDYSASYSDSDAICHYVMNDDGTLLLSDGTKTSKITLDGTSYSSTAADAVPEMTASTIGSATWTEHVTKEDGTTEDIPHTFAPLDTRDSGIALFDSKFYQYKATVETGDDGTRTISKIILEPLETKDETSYKIYEVNYSDGTASIQETRDISVISGNTSGNGVEYDQSEFKVTMKLGVIDGD